MTKEKILELYPDTEFFLLRGFDDALTGVAISNGNHVTCYSVKKMINTLMTRDNMSAVEAMEFLEFNTLYAYFGPLTPVYLEDTDE